MALKPIQHAGSIEASDAMTSAVDGAGAAIDFDTATGTARVTAKGGAGASTLMKIRTLLAGVLVDALTFAANGLATFAAGITAPSLTITTAVGLVSVPGAANGAYQIGGVSALYQDGSSNVRLDSPTAKSIVLAPAGTPAITIAASGGVAVTQLVSANGGVARGTAYGRVGVATAGVAASATTIFTATFAEVTRIHVTGNDGAGKIFLDRVAYVSGNTPVVQESTTLAGAPAARTYTVVLGALKLAMASGTYTIKCAPNEIA